MYARRAIAADLDEIVALSRRFHAESPHHRVMAFSADKVRALVDAARKDPDWLVVMVVSDDGPIIGMALMYALPAYFSDDLEVQDLAFYVAPEKRGTRAAKLMIDMIYPWFVGTGARALTIGINTGINHDQAARFFARFGLLPRGILVGNNVA